MKFQLCTRDEYNSTAIVKSSDDVSVLVAEAKKLVCADNMENALTLAEQKREWESCFVEFLDDDGEVIENAIYAGKTPGGRDRLYLINDGEIVEHLIKDVEVNMQFYIGEVVVDRKNNVKNVIFAERQKAGKPGETIRVDNFSDSNMEGKTTYFINSLKK